jgi:formate dehydrogenase major subunit
MKSIANQKRIKVTVNGREVEVYDNLTILQSLLQEDIAIPHLCYDIRLDRANGNCGLCVVELGEKGQELDVKACQTRSWNGCYHHGQPPPLNIPQHPPGTAAFRPQCGLRRALCPDLSGQY